jgi:hypothetical protein
VAKQRQVTWTWVMAGATVVNPLLNLILISVTQDKLGNGAIGAAISLLVTELLIVAAGFGLTGLTVVGRVNARRCGLAALASLATCGAAYATRPLGTVPSLAAAAVTFIFLAVVLRVATTEEIAFARARLARRLPARWRRFAVGLR